MVRVVRWAGRCSVTGEGGWNLSFCRNKAVKLLKRLDRMGENKADPGIEGWKDAVRGFFEREGPERRVYGKKKRPKRANEASKSLKTSPTFETNPTCQGKYSVSGTPQASSRLRLNVETPRPPLEALCIEDTSNERERGTLSKTDNTCESDRLHPQRGARA